MPSANYNFLGHDFAEDCEVVSVEIVRHVESSNLDSQPFYQDAQRWDVRYVLHGDRAMRSEVRAWLAKQRGAPFLIKMPQDYSSIGQDVSFGTLTLSAKADAGAKTLAVDSYTGKVKEGMFVSVAGHTKVHLLTDVSADSISIEPGLLADAADNASVNLEPSLRCTRFGGFSFSLREDGLYDFAFDVREKLS